MSNGTNKAMSEHCHNPLCVAPVVSHPKAVKPRRYCCDGCKLDAWAFRRVSKLLLPLGSKGWEILRILQKEDVPVCKDFPEQQGGKKWT